MNLTQQTSLETLAGRALTQKEIDLANAREDAPLSAFLSIGRTALVSTLKTERGILSALGPIAGDAFLTGLENFVAAGVEHAGPLAPFFGAIRRSVSWLKTDGLDMADPAVRGTLDALASAGVLATSSVATVKNLALHPDSISLDAVSAILNSGN